MATQRTKAWFTDVPATSDYDRLNTNNIPSADTFADLLESILMKEETATDSATDSQLGYVLIASDAHALARTNASTLPNEVVIPSQLPLLMVNTTELDHGDSAVNYDGLKYEVVTGDDSGRASFKIEFDPDSLTDVTAGIGDRIVIVDATDGKPKTLLLSSIGSEIWTRDGDSGEVSLTEPSDEINIGDSGIHFGDGLLDNGADRTFGVETVTDNAGKGLTVFSGQGTIAGGDLNLSAGPATLAGGSGGDINLYGGSGTNEGNVLSCWTGSVKRGTMGIGGAVVAGSQLAVYGKVKVVSGGLEVNGAGVSALDSFIGFDANNAIQERTRAQFHNDLVESLSEGDILYYNGTSLVKLAIGTEGQFLTAGASVPEWGDAPGSSSMVSAHDGTTPGYLDSVLVEKTNGGVDLTRDGDIIEVSMDISGLEAKLTVTGDTYIAVVDETSPTSQTKKILLSDIADWVIARIPAA